MAGLLSDVLPWVYSQGDRAKRYMKGLLSDPVGSAQQTAGLLSDKHREMQALQAQAFPDQSRPFKVGDSRALGQMADAMLAGPLGFAPAGITVWHGSPHRFDKFDVSQDKRGVGGVWASDSKSYAESFAGKNGSVYKVDADVKKPYVFDIMEEARKIADEIGVDRPKNPVEAQELLAGGMSWDSVVSDVLHEAKRSGHDALQIKNFNDNYHSNPFDVTTAYVFPSDGLLKILERNGKPVR